MTGTSLLRLLLLLVLLCAESIVLGLTHHRHTSDGGGGDPDGADGKYTCCATLHILYDVSPLGGLAPCEEQSE